MGQIYNADVVAPIVIDIRYHFDSGLDPIETLKSLHSTYGPFQEWGSDDKFVFIDLIMDYELPLPVIFVSLVYEALADELFDAIRYKDPKTRMSVILGYNNRLISYMTSHMYTISDGVVVDIDEDS